MRITTLLSFCIAGWIAANYCTATEPKFPPDQIEFFEAKVRPILADHCLRCHGEKKQQASLRLDSREAILKGSDSGKVVQLDQPEKSLLIRVLHYDGDLKMPPKGKLSGEQIELLSQWVKLGLPFPASTKPVTVDVAKSHWAFQPVKPVQIPTVADQNRVANPIDSFVIAKLEANQLKLNPRADRRTLIRRVYYDLIGLPPTLQEIEAFEQDQSPLAWEKLIDRLLENPHYGERWARYWLDLARYSDTKGYVFQEDRNYPYAYTYRDWVIRSFNEDLPYNQFIMQQIAADRMPLENDNRSLAAMGFLTLGRRFINNIHDIIDDRIDVVTRTFMGLTVTCARCHDHKYDPIPTKDYYSLYAIFNSSVEPKELPMIGEIQRTEEYLAFERELQKREAELNQLVQNRFAAKLASIQEPKSIALYLSAIRDYQQKPTGPIQTFIRSRDLNGFLFNRWKAFVESEVQAKSPIFTLFEQLSRIPDDQWEQQSIQKVANLIGNNEPIHADLIQLFSDTKLKNFNDVATIYAQWLGTTLSATADATTADIRKCFQKENSPFQLVASRDSQIFDRADRNQLTAAQRKIDSFKATSPAAPPRAMVMNDSPNPANIHVFVRGNPNNRGPVVPRQFLEVIAGSNRKPIDQGSGRFEMAQAIADPNNPLTARVMVNRIWLHHFGYGLVRTPSDFGIRCEPPTHPELLDYLAIQFGTNQWSIKKLHKLILLSETYQQSSEVSESHFKADPENRLLGRMNRRRLDFESMRDSFLAVGGQLDRGLHGKSEDLFREPFTQRRTLYGFIDRQNLPGTFRAFDFASPDTHSPQRFNTTVPQQALFLLNSPFVVEQAKAVVNRANEISTSDSTAKIRRIYQLIYARNPSDAELDVTSKFIQSHSPADQLEPEDSTVWEYGYGSFDEMTNRVKFTKLPHFTERGWQGGPVLPDPKLDWCFLSAAGGHPGSGKDRMIIRRWVAPTDGIIKITGLLQHPTKEGDGIRARIVHSRRGLLETWLVHNRQQNSSFDAIEVKKGDFIDFIVDEYKTITHDGFGWNLSLQLTHQSTERSFDSVRDFRGPPPRPKHPISNWERLAQVLLLSNEFAFVD